MVFVLKIVYISLMIVLSKTRTLPEDPKILLYLKFSVYLIHQFKLLKRNCECNDWLDMMQAKYAWF